MHHKFAFKSHFECKFMRRISYIRYIKIVNGH